MQKECQAKIEDYTLALENRSKQLDELYLKEVITSKENETLKVSLIEISSEIQAKEIENVELAYKNQSLQKQMAVLDRQALEYHEVEKIYKEKI